MFRQGSSPHDICSFISSKLSQAGLSQKLTIIDPYALAYDVQNPKNLKNPTAILTEILEPFKGHFHTLELVIASQNSTNRPEQHIDNLKNNLGVDVTAQLSHLIFPKKQQKSAMS